LIAGKDFKQYLDEAKPIVDENIIKVADIRSQIIQFLLNYNEFSGYKSLSFRFFNNKLKGLRMGEFTILTGETGGGKTTFLSQLSIDFLQQRIPTLWGSFEIKNDKLASMFLMQYAKKDLRQTKVEEIEFYTESFEKLPLYLLKFHGSQNIDEVLTTMEYARYNYDIQNIILDNLQFMIGLPSKVVNRFDLQDEIIHKLRKFATDKNVHITLVIHPKKTDESLTISSIFGTAKASQEADNIFIIQSLKGLRVIEIAKNRFDGTVGKIIMGFDQKTCRFFEVTEDEFTQVQDGKARVNDIIENRIKQHGCVEYNNKDNNIEQNKLIEIPMKDKETYGPSKIKILVDKAKKENIEFINTKEQNTLNVLEKNDIDDYSIFLDTKIQSDLEIFQKIEEELLVKSEENAQVENIEIKTKDVMKNKGEVNLIEVLEEQTKIQNQTDQTGSDKEKVEKSKPKKKQNIPTTISTDCINTVDNINKFKSKNTQTKKINEIDKSTEVKNHSIAYEKKDNIELAKVKPFHSNLNIPRIYKKEKFTYLEDHKNTFLDIIYFQRRLFPNINLIDNFHTEESISLSKAIISTRNYKKRDNNHKFDLLDN
jgi:twinkle protein